MADTSAAQPATVDQENLVGGRERSNTWPSAPVEVKKTEEPTSSSRTAGAAPNSGSHRKLSRRNAWGSMSYAELITRAILSSPEKRKTLNQIYEWMVENVAYFRDKGDTNSSAGWKNSIRHNLSLHQRFVRIPNEQTGKSSWWTINPDAKPGRQNRRRALSVDSGTSPVTKPRSAERKRPRRTKQIKSDTNVCSSPVRSPANTISPSSWGSSSGMPHSPSPSSLKSDSLGSAASAPSYLTGNSPLASPIFVEPTTYDDMIGDGSEGSSFDDAGSFLSGDQLSDLKLNPSDDAMLDGITEDQIDTAIASLDIDMKANQAPSTYRLPFMPSLSPVFGTPFDTPVAGVSPHGTPPPIPRQHHTSSGSGPYLEQPTQYMPAQNHYVPTMLPWQQSQQQHASQHLQIHHQQQLLQQQLQMQHQFHHLQQQQHLQQQMQQQQLLRQHLAMPHHAIYDVTAVEDMFGPPTYNSSHMIVPSTQGKAMGPHLMPAITHPLAEADGYQPTGASAPSTLRASVDSNRSDSFNGTVESDMDQAIRQAIQNEDALVFNFDHFSDKQTVPNSAMAAWTKN